MHLQERDVPWFAPAIFAAALLAPASAAVATPVIVETPALSPEQQREKFNLPEGFEIQLVAAEPDIGQPMNLSFDPLGRLWATHSVEYPFPAQGEGVQPRDMREDRISEHDPQDHVTCFEELGPAGRAARVTHFVSGLNIPIGQWPTVSSDEITSAIVYSIPSISLYRDRDGDGVADESQVLFTGFGNVDAHGMCNSFTRGFDGWLYACHGFRNTSHIHRPGGPDELVLSSGNTWRFQPDGSAVEQFTWGQVNPFGMTFDPWGNLYNADCHSYPVTLLLRGAYYESFGKPHDGLGFGPVMIDHNHGSTGICGVAYYDAPQFPEEFRDCLYICNPVNGQVHRDRLVWTGSSPKADTQPDFVTCDDGWFRPVDVKLGPDGALYIADFYNSIIGHYEAPLQHPLRDRRHGRIWRVVYTGRPAADGGGQPPAPLPDLLHQSTQDLVDRLADPNLTVRMLATNLLVDRFAPPLPQAAAPDEATAAARSTEPLLEPLKRVLGGAESPAEVGAVHQRVHAAWVWDRLARIRGDESLDMLEILSHDRAAEMRAHVARMLAEHRADSLRMSRLLLALLGDDDPRVRRAAAEALARHPRPDQIHPLLETMDAAPAGDTHLVHAVRIALREHLRSPGPAAAQFASWGFRQEKGLADVSVAVRPASVELVDWLHDFLNRTLDSTVVTPEERRDWLTTVARGSQGESLSKLVAEARARAGNDLAEHVDKIDAIVAGRRAASAPLPNELTDWAAAVAMQLMAAESRRDEGWIDRPLPGRTAQEPAFAIEGRPSADGVADALFFSTLPRGEQRTGVLRSQPFVLPQALSFWIAGHDGFPEEPAGHKNLVRLIEAETGVELMEAAPPRNDIAQPVNWSIAKSGQRAVIEIVDADTAGAYAWLAVGRFSLPELNPTAAEPGEQAVSLIRDLRLTSLAPRLKALALTADSGAARRKAAEACLALEPDSRLSALLPWVTADISAAGELRERIYMALVSRDPAEIDAALREVVARASTPAQEQLADALASDALGAEALLNLATEGRLSPRLLQRPQTEVRLKALKIKGLDERVEQLTAALPPADEQTNRLIAERRARYDAAQASAERGRTSFNKRCAVCHQLAGEGQKVGPQLDGIGVRGLDRLLEDILDPNRNVDAAFRSSTLALTDGRIMTGLQRREEGDALILVNQEGKEFRVPQADIEDSKLSPLSLMPANLGEVLPPDEFNDLMAWMLSCRAPH